MPRRRAPRRDEEARDDREPLEWRRHRLAPLAPRPSLVNPQQREVAVDLATGLADPGTEPVAPSQPPRRVPGPAEWVAVVRVHRAQKPEARLDVLGPARPNHPARKVPR
jgi:hypothetical protein